MSTDVVIYWDNLPVCGEDGIIISPYICVPPDGWHPPVDPVPPTPVPVPGTMALLLVGIVLLGLGRRRQTP